MTALTGSVLVPPLVLLLVCLGVTPLPTAAGAASVALRGPPQALALLQEGESMALAEEEEEEADGEVAGLVAVSAGGPPTQPALGAAAVQPSSEIDAPLQTATESPSSSARGPAAPAPRSTAPQPAGPPAAATAPPAAPVPAAAAVAPVAPVPEAAAASPRSPLPKPLAQPQLAAELPRGSANTSALPAALVHSESCSPGCIVGQGACEAGMCFCKTAFTGLQCEKKAKSQMPFTYPNVVFLSMTAAGFGALLGVFAARAICGRRSGGSTEATTQRKVEIWRPSRA